MATPQRKTKRRNNQAQPQAQPPQQQQQEQQQAYYQQITDYETDYPDQPPPMERTNEDLNIKVLRRHWPDINIILSIAPFAELYVFSPEARKWEKSGQAGTLFVCALTSHDPEIERYSVVILNRRGLENFAAEIKSTDDVEITEEFVIVKDGDEEDAKIYGLWIFTEPEPDSTAHARVINAGVIEEVAGRAEASRKRALERIAEEKRLRERMQDEEQEQGNGYNAEESEIEEEGRGAAMGRQLNLSQLFNRQREQDSGFSVHNHQSEMASLDEAQQNLPYLIEIQTENFTAQTHHEPVQLTPPTQAPAQVPTPQFQTHPDTDFFRSGPKFTPQQEQSGHGAGHGVPVDGGNALLEDMLRRQRAGQ